MREIKVIVNRPVCAKCGEEMTDPTRYVEKYIWWCCCTWQDGPKPEYEVMEDG